MAESKRRNFRRVPDLAEPKQEKEKHASKVDALAQRPAIAIAYHMPERNTPEYYAMGLIDQILIEGDDSLEYQELVQKKGLTAEVEGGINYLGNMFNYKGPMLFMADFKTDPGTSPDTVVKAWDAPIEALRTKPVSRETLDRATSEAALRSLRQHRSQSADLDWRTCWQALLCSMTIPRGSTRWFLNSKKLRRN